MNISTKKLFLCTKFLPLHDITNVVQNLITELPAHIENKKAQQEFEKFSELTIGDKNQLKGSDARLYAIKLVKFVSSQYSEGKISKDIVDMCIHLLLKLSQYATVKTAREHRNRFLDSTINVSCLAFYANA